VRPEPTTEAVIIRKKKNPYIPQAGRYSSVDWLANLRGLPNSTVLYRIRSPVLWTCVCALLVCAAHSLLHPRGLFPRLGTIGHSIAGGALGLLLVFRTNTAYSRFWEGRCLWEYILDVGRNLARAAVLFRNELGPDATARICRLVQAFPFCMIEHLRGKADKALRVKLEKLVQDPGQPSDSDLALATNRPLFVVNRLAATIAVIPNDAACRFTNRERVWLLGTVDKLSSTIGACERLVQTPVPLTYVRHTSRFLSLFMLTLPLALVDQLGLATVPMTGLLSWALFSILEIGLLIEDPFQRVLKLDVIADTLEKDILETRRFLGCGESPEASRTASSYVETVPSPAAGGVKDDGPHLQLSRSARGESSSTGGSVDPSSGGGGKGIPGKSLAENALAAFRRYDENGDGKISCAELRTALRDVDPMWTDERVSTVFKQVDINGDGSIEYSEWVAWAKTASESDLIRVSGMPSSAPLPADSTDDHTDDQREADDGELASHDVCGDEPVAGREASTAEPCAQQSQATGPVDAP